jgi:chromosome segregation ATPase
MAGEERDARLILRAEDRASRTFEQVAKSVREVRQEITQQAKEAERGVGSLDSYNRVLRNMKDLGDDLIGQQALIRRFETITDKVGAAEARLQKANTALDEFNRKSAAGETIPKSLANAPERVQAATAALEKQQRELGLVSDRMQAAGLSADNLDAQYGQIAASAREAAAGIAQAKTNLDGYEDVARRAAAANEALQKSQRFETAAAASPLPIEQLVYISQFDDALDRLKQSEREMAALSSFRQVGAEAAAAAADVSRFGATVDDSESKVQGLANAVRGALGGSNASIQNLETAIENVDRALAAATAKSTKVNELQESAGKLAIAQATLVRTAEKVDAFRAQEQAVAAAEARFTSAQREVERLAAAMAEADTPTEALTQDMTRARDAMERAGLAMQKERDQAARLSLALKQAGVDTANLDRVQDQLVASSQRAGQTQTQLTGKLKGKGGFLGLNPFELQNLSYRCKSSRSRAASWCRFSAVACCRSLPALARSSWLLV